jgi:hypothetical protein
MTEKSNLEKYLSGEPLTDDLRQVRDGMEAAEYGFAGLENLVARGAPAAGTGPITRADRELLKESKASGVLAIIERTLKKTLETHIESARIDSEQDPLGRAAEISQRWAYIAMYRRALVEFSQLIDAEIAELDGERFLDRHQAERTAG